jgi:hypothetical protein
MPVRDAAFSLRRASLQAIKCGLGFCLHHGLHHLLHAIMLSADFADSRRFVCYNFSPLRDRRFRQAPAAPGANNAYKYGGNDAGDSLTRTPLSIYDLTI